MPADHAQFDHNKNSQIEKMHWLLSSEQYSRIVQINVGVFDEHKFNCDKMPADSSNSLPNVRTMEVIPLCTRHISGNLLSRIQAFIDDEKTLIIIQQLDYNLSARNIALSLLSYLRNIQLERMLAQNAIGFRREFKLQYYNGELESIHHTEQLSGIYLPFKIRRYNRKTGRCILLAKNSTKNPIFEKFSDLLGEEVVDLEHAYFRFRGSLVVLLETRSGQTYVARYATNSHIDAFLSKNAKSIKLIKSLIDDKGTAALIPNQIPSKKPETGHVYFEERKPGVLMWTIGERYDQALPQCVDFLAELAKATLTQRLFHEFNADLSGKYFSVFSRFGKHHPKLGEHLSNIKTELQKKDPECKISTIIGHGDFGHGNILVDPKTYQLTGIIDWDTYVAQELPGVDLLNLLMNRYSSRTAMPLGKAADEILSNIKRQQGLEFECWDRYWKTLGIDCDAPSFVLMITCCRILARDLRYKQECKLSPEHIGVFEFISSKLSF